VSTALASAWASATPIERVLFAQGLIEALLSTSRESFHEDVARGVYLTSGRYEKYSGRWDKITAGVQELEELRGLGWSWRRIGEAVGNISGERVRQWYVRGRTPSHHRGRLQGLLFELRGGPGTAGVVG
jgi:hypothetical protein